MFFCQLAVKSRKWEVEHKNVAQQMRQDLIQAFLKKSCERSPADKQLFKIKDRNNAATPPSQMEDLTNQNHFGVWWMLRLHGPKRNHTLRSAWKNTLSIFSSHTSQSCLFFFILQINKSWFGLWFLRTSASPRPEDILLQLQQKGVQGWLRRVWEESRKKKTRTTLSLSVNLDF